MPSTDPTLIYLLTSVPSAMLTEIVDRFSASGFKIVFDQPAVWQAIDALVPGDKGNAAYVSVYLTEANRPSDELRANGRLQGLKSVDSNLILFTAVIFDGDVFIQSSSDSSIHLAPDDLSSIIPAAITYISKKLGQRSARTAEKKEALAEVNRSLETHITPILTALVRQERNLKSAAMVFYGVALLTLLAGLWVAIMRVRQLHDKPLASWFDVVATSVGGLIVIGMLTAVARLAFILGRSFMVESLTNGDRAHAISFGRFYLQVFKDRAEWSEIKEAFQNWNIDRGSSFVAQNAGDVDPIVLQVATEVAKAVVAKGKG